MSKYPFWTDEARRGLLSDIGEDGLRRFEEACEFARNQTDIWLNRPLADAWSEVESVVRAMYWDFDEEATLRIVAIAAYDWK
jgi:hypothetical protein